MVYKRLGPGKPGRGAGASIQRRPEAHARQRQAGEQYARSAREPSGIGSPPRAELVAGSLARGAAYVVTLTADLATLSSWTTPPVLTRTPYCVELIANGL
jgi:hypothetical protein